MLRVYQYKLTQLCIAALSLISYLIFIVLYFPLDLLATFVVQVRSEINQMTLDLQDLGDKLLNVKPVNVNKITEDENNI